MCGGAVSVHVCAHVGMYPFFLSVLTFSFMVGREIKSEASILFSQVSVLLSLHLTDCLW